jgi:hypothetical protein
MTKLSKADEQIIDAIVEYTKNTRDMAEGITGWGGKREGAGRPSTGRSKRIIYVTDSEYEQVKALIEECRK